jgi:UDP-N-acetylglucosamine diphosphorylase/glucosamine-1-phosphate N-acetyltransferase
MKFVLFEDQGCSNLLPLVYYRPVWELRCGVFTIEEKLRRYLQNEFYYLSRKYLMDYYLDDQKLAFNLLDSQEILLINGRWLMTPKVSTLIDELQPETVLVSGENILAFRTSLGEVRSLMSDNETILESKKILNKFPAASRRDIMEAKVIDYLWNAISWNGEEIERDYGFYNQTGKIEGIVYEGAQILNREHVTIERGAVVKPGVVIDAEKGPVWINKGANIMPNSVLVGPLYIGEKSTVKIGAKIYENTTVGPVCKVGGEIEGCIIQGYSNKQHDGFLGHAYLGEWVNLGADTNNSDLKNNYGYIRVLVNGKSVDTELRFMGLIMGDHSKCAINTMFNTGTIIGVNCNIFGAGMPPKFVPSFSWGGTEGLSVYDFDKAVELAEIVTGRRNISFGEPEKKLFAAARDLAKRVEAGTLIR